MSSRKRPRVRECASSGKHGAHDLHVLERMARSVVLRTNQAGEVMAPLYWYRCPSCRLLHMTRRPYGPDHDANQLLYAAPVELQRWAIGSGA